MGWHLLTAAKRQAMAQGATELTDDMPGGQACDRCGKRELTMWHPLFGENMCITCRNLATDRELERTRGSMPVQVRAVPAARLPDDAEGTP